MTYEEFDGLFEQTVNECRDLITRKGDDYANGEERFHNFNRVSSTLKISPEMVLWVYLDKHLGAIGNYVSRGKVESEPIEGRINDAITYLFLLRGMVAEKTCGIK